MKQIKISTEFIILYLTTYFIYFIFYSVSGMNLSVKMNVQHLYQFNGG